MSKLYILKGLPASGKSTRAAEIIREAGNTVRINKDLLRTMLHFDRFTGRNEGHTRDASRKLADWYLANGVNVIIDDTNLYEGTVQSWKDLAKIHNANIEYVDHTDVPVETCIERDAARDKKVGSHVIQKMALQHLGYMNGQPVVICDLDGTLCDIGHRLHFVQKEQGQKDWRGFFDGISGDSLREDVFASVKRQCGDYAAALILVSARPEDYRKQTEEWLAKQGIEYRLLIMRESGDKRADTEVKSEIYDKYLANLKITRVFDDRPSVIRMWRDKGLGVENCGDGIEF